MDSKLPQAERPPALLATLLVALLLTVPAANSAPLRHRRRHLDPGLLLAEQNRRVITVSKDGRGNFRTIKGAIRSIPRGNTRRVVVKIGPGVYREKILVRASKPYVTFYGQPQAMPTISYGGTAASKNGTWGSATVAVESDYFVAANIIFENTAPRPRIGKEDAQAVAMRISGDKAAFFNCKFHGFQDTLCDDKGKHFFKDCFIRGTVDFIFGYGRSLYKNCEIQSVADGVTYITAQGRNTSDDHGGFSFVDCRITGTGSAYLGRAWKNMSRVVFARTYMGEHVNQRGWDDKGFPDRQKTVFFGEYKCTGPGAVRNRRVSYGMELNDEQAKPFLTTRFVQGRTWLLPPPRLMI